MQSDHGRGKEVREGVIPKHVIYEHFISQGSKQKVNKLVGTGKRKSESNSVRNTDKSQFLFFYATIRAILGKVCASTL